MGYNTYRGKESTFSQLRRRSDEDVKQAVASSISFCEALKKLGLKHTGASWATFKRRVVKMGLDTSHFLGLRAAAGKRGRGRSKYLTWESLLVIGRDLPSKLLRRAYKEYCAQNSIEIRCQCGLSNTWNEKPLKLEVHHIDGKRKNNEPTNLSWRCPNCHSQEPVVYRNPHG